MAPSFGTSGLRGLAVELTPEFVARYTRAFLASCDHGGRIFIGWDLRPSSPSISDVIASTASAEGVDVVRAGAVPTPALALAAQDADCGAIMVTGSHIPADRNGIKFYTRAGEITKPEEEAITAALDAEAAPSTPATIVDDAEVGRRFVHRYVTAFGGQALAGLTIGVYTHSAVGRDALMDVLSALGATVREFGRSDTFIPVDTEAVDPDTRQQFKAWVDGLDALVSTDGDSDRPMLTDAAGQVIPGDILGQITARLLAADAVVTPISSNSSVGARGFDRVAFTRIGSPYVIAGMEAETGRVVGYEANGGFLLGFDADAPAGVLPPLATRDSFLPIIAPLAAAQAEGVSVADLAEREAIRHTAADRLKDTPTDLSRAFIATLQSDAGARAALLRDAGLGVEAGVDETDGLRITDETGSVLHLRPSGNAPELRVYIEAETAQLAQQTLAKALGVVAARVAAA